MHNKIWLVVIALSLLFLQLKTGFAQTDTAAQKDRITIYGLADAYYSYNFNAYADDKVIPYVYNYKRHNEFNLNMVMFGIKYSGERERMALSLQAGTFVFFNYATEPAIFQHIHEGYAGFKPFKKQDIWIDAGIFNSHIGLETAVAQNNWTLTQSLAAEYSPYFETGIRATYTINNKWKFVLLALNGWQNILDNNNNKAIGTQLVFTPFEKLRLNSSTYIGEGRNAPIGFEQHTRYFHDLYATWMLTKKLGIAGVFDYGLEKESEIVQYPWWSSALLLKYDLHPKFSVCARGEYFNDPNEILVPTGDPEGFQVAGASLNVDYKPSSHTMLRVEGKHYLSQGEIFFVPGSGYYVPYSTTITSSLVVWF